ncbi:MAG: type III-B CRISPR-associated protein Cas10/Cmr2 [Acidobacteria bacterium]|nr:type III-B CRISPR-associated protein Cas10/Cmr2 [Acidobacteriota bacterium]
MPTQYLMAIAIGPVQEFIATARRSRDLWFGSWLLSQMSKAVAEVIVKRYKKESLIFPASDDPNDLDVGSDFTVVNKIIAVVENPEQLAKEIKTALDTTLETMRQRAYKDIPRDEYFDKDGEDRAIKQVADLKEFFWAAVPLNDYRDSRELVEAMLAARKNTRDFRSTKDWADAVPKSSLDGLRESVIKDKAYDDLSEEELRRRYRVRPGERLCGVGLLKRLGNLREDDSFFSTSHVAALPLLSSLKDDCEPVVKQYIEKLKKHGISETDLNEVPLPPSKKAYPKAFQRNDGHLLFKERLRDYFPGKSQMEKEKRKLAEDALACFNKQAFGQDKEPLAYYALLLADGDRMGAVIDAQPDKDRHRALSLKLSEFAKGVRKIAENEPHHGSLVYSGGDDVLAFLPLHTALDCARALATDFQDKLNEFKDAESKSPTLSVGIAISHHLDPLSDALELARSAEKEAKRVEGKNALCVKVDKRSGEVTTVKGKRGELEERLEYFTLLHIAEAVPDGAAYELRDLAERLKELKDAQQPEAIRILKRKRGGHGQESLDKKVIERLEALVEKVELAELADELIVARLLAAAKEQSGWTVKMAKDKLNEEVEQ